MKRLRFPTRIRTAGRALAVTGFLASVLLPSCFPSQPEEQLDLCVVRIDPAEEPFAIGGSLTVFAAMLLFGWLVVRRERAARSFRASAVPAE